MNRHSICIIFLISTLFSSLFAQEDSDNATTQGTEVSNEFDIRVKKVRDSIFMLIGKGGNIGLLTGLDGAILIDGQFSESTTKILNTVSNLTSQPVQFVIYTNHRSDHAGSIKNMRESGVISLAHENVKKNLFLEERKKVMDSIEKKVQGRISKTQNDNLSPEEHERASKEEMSRFDFDMDLDDATFPMITFSQNLSLSANNEEIEVHHLPNAHSSGDIVVYFKTTNVLHTGDSYIKDKYPMIDYEHGGSFEGYRRGLEKILSLINDETLIIPGHGELARLSDVRFMKSMMDHVYNRVSYYRVDNKTEEQVLAMKEITKEFDEKGFGAGLISTEDFVRSVYKEAANKYRWNDKNKGKQ